ncbi:MAG: PHP domain-containing protein [Bacillota bacterium]|nr:PHP domain-containing protein [Bacillota bacterium]
MIYSDLHIHSRYSDGILTPSEIIDFSISSNINCISITDHDSVQSQSDSFSNLPDLKVIPGIELSSEYNGYEIHLLGYFIDINDTSLKKILDQINKERAERLYSIVDRLKKLNVDVSISEIEINKFVTLGRPHIAKLLIEKGYVNSIKEAFHIYLAKGRPAYIERYKISYKEALKLIRDCRGISVLAHPGEIYKGINMEKLIKDLKIYGLNGIEVFHPSHKDRDINNFYNFAIKYHLVISGGSDYHGSNSKGETGIGSKGLDKKLTTKFIDYYSKYIGGHK